MPELKSDKVMECQNMKYNCCTETDMARLEELWDNTYSKNIKFNHYYFTFFIREIIRYDEEYKKKAVFIKSQNTYPVCQNAATLISEFEFPEEFDTHMNALIKKVYDFDLAMKKGFTCFLCDFDNSKNIEIDTKSVFMNINVCDSIITHTFEFNEFFNNYVYKYINTVAMLSHCINTHELLEKREEMIKEKEHENQEELDMMKEQDEKETERIKEEVEQAERDSQGGRILEG